MVIDESLSWPKGAGPSPALSDGAERAAVLEAYGFDDLEDDPELIAIVRFASRLCDAPISLVSLVEQERQRFLARDGSDLRETPRDVSFCARAMLQGEAMVVPDATCDPRFSDNALVTGKEQVRFYAGAPLISPEGAPLGALCVIDRTARPDGLTDLQREGLAVLAQAVMRRLHSRRVSRETSQEASESNRRMREIADMMPAIIWSADGDGRFDYFNRKWSDVTGCDRPKLTDDWRAVVYEEDAEKAFGAWEKSFGAGQPFESEYRLRQADGSWRWTLSRALPFHAPDGTVSRWFGTLTDVDAGHRLSDNREILARELSHRIKNIFAVVSGLVALRQRKHPAAKGFAQELIGAIRALGRAHDFVRPLEGEKGDSLRGLLAELMAPYQDADGERVRIEGGDCEIGARAATPLALVFHELATNSAKYGALSAEGGEVSIHLECPDEEDRAHIRWRESGGPEIGEPNEDGFGSRLIEMSVESQLSGRLDRRFAPGGLEIDLEFKSSVIRS